jgi:hypothetical protein
MRAAIFVLLLGALAAGVLWLQRDGGAAPLRELERLAPAARAPECVPRGPYAHAFAAALAQDPRREAHRDCLHGRAGPVLRQMALTAGERAEPFFEEVLTRCHFEEPDSPACAALDALEVLGTPAARARLAQQAQIRYALHEFWLGAQERLWRLQGGPSSAQLVALLSDNDAANIFARRDLVEHLRQRRDPTVRGDLERLYRGHGTPELKAQLRAAMLELDHPGHCVSEDEGQGRGDRCVYRCPGEAALRAIAKLQGVSCPLSFAP